MNKTVRLFEFVAFHRSVDIRNKEKINAIAGVKDRLGYTCFDWFELDMQNALKITLEISTYFLLFFQGYLLYIQQLWDFGTKLGWKCKIVHPIENFSDSCPFQLFKIRFYLNNNFFFTEDSLFGFSMKMEADEEFKEFVKFKPESTSDR